MTPETLKGLTDAVNSIGLLGLVIVAVWAFYTRRIVTRRELQEGDAEAERQVAYIEARRAEERQARLDAEQRLATLVGSVDRLTDVLSAVQVEVLRGRPSSGGEK